MAADEYRGTDVKIWDGTCTFIPNVGMTPFQFYDSDTQFQADAVKVAKFCAYRLGYPIMDVELQSGSFFTCFEEAVTTYGNTIYEFKVAENYMSLEGGSRDIDANNMVLEPTLNRVIEIAKNYGSEAEVGGNITLHKGFLELKENVQDYDLDAWAIEQGVVGGIEIRKIFYEAPPAILRYFDPYAGTGTGIQSLMDAFDFGSYSPGVNFLLMPISHDLLQIQAIEFNDQVRKSTYSFQIVNNKLKIFPIPTCNSRLRIEYYKLSDKRKLNTKTSKITSMSTLRKDFSVVVPESIEGWQESVTKTFNHDLGTMEVTVQCYQEETDMLGNTHISQFIPGEVKILDENNISVTFAETTTGYIVIGYPDTEIIVNGTVKMSHKMGFDVIAPSDGVVSHRFNHNLNTKEITVQVYQEINGETKQIIPDSIELVSNNQVIVTFRSYIDGTDKNFYRRTQGYIVIGYPKHEEEDDGSNVITNVSEVPYENPTYAKINSVGRQWIFRYTLALARELLAYIRGKYSTVPIPDSEATLNQNDLLTDARDEKNKLIEQLRTMLESTSRVAQLEKKSQESEYLNKTLQGVPMCIFIG